MEASWDVGQGSLVTSRLSRKEQGPAWELRSYWLHEAKVSLARCGQGSPVPTTDENQGQWEVAKQMVQSLPQMGLELHKLPAWAQCPQIHT